MVRDENISDDERNNNDAYHDIVLPEDQPNDSPTSSACSAEQFRVVLMQRLDSVITWYEAQEQEAKEADSRKAKKRRQLMCAAAADCRRFGSGTVVQSEMKASLLQLAEHAYGQAVLKRCEDALLPDVNYCDLPWQPSAFDHNNELCRVPVNAQLANRKRSRPVAEMM